MIRTEEMLLNVGPQHPSTHGVFRLVIKIDGEIIKKLHRLLDICIAGPKRLQRAYSIRKLSLIQIGWTIYRL